jgi:hypothetical protein
MNTRAVRLSLPVFALFIGIVRLIRTRIRLGLFQG